MYKLYKVNNSQKLSVRGFCIDKGKLYKDNISIKGIKGVEALNRGIQALFRKGEMAVFYTLQGKGYCIDNKGKISILHKRLRLHRKKLSCKEFKKLVLKFGGLTCYKLIDRYIIEIFYN